MCKTGKIMADAAAAAGVKVFVFSTLEDADKRCKASLLYVPLCMCPGVCSCECMARVVLLSFWELAPTSLLPTSQPISRGLQNGLEPDRDY